jgi:endonuclease/exonuclease/phosphatase (EEP) superfamily protein YafD
VATWTCAAGVAAYALALRLVAESWWVTTVALYLPHAAWLVPLGALALGLAAFGPRRLLPVPAAAAAVVLFPVMGLTLSGPERPTPGAPRLRVLSFNADRGRALPGLVAEILEARPDVVLLQESVPAASAAVAAALPGFEARASTQFLVASRYPIAEFHEPPKVRLGGLDLAPRFVHAVLETPLGRIAVFDVHPISPRDAIDSVQAGGILVGLRPGALLGSDRRVVTRNAALRQLQARTVAALAAASPDPVIVAGDTNLPGGSRILAEAFGELRDGFAEVGRGFGYTFPEGRGGPWMRIDRILAGPELRFLEFGVGGGRGSDHRCVWADLERAPGG